VRNPTDQPYAFVVVVRLLAIAHGESYPAIEGSETRRFSYLPTTWGVMDLWRDSRGKNHSLWGDHLVMMTLTSETTRFNQDLHDLRRDFRDTTLDHRACRLGSAHPVVGPVQ